MCIRDRVYGVCRSIRGILTENKNFDNKEHKKIKPSEKIATQYETRYIVQMLVLFNITFETDKLADVKSRFIHPRNTSISAGCCFARRTLKYLCFFNSDMIEVQSFVIL